MDTEFFGIWEAFFFTKFSEKDTQKVEHPTLFLFKSGKKSISFLKVEHSTSFPQNSDIRLFEETFDFFSQNLENSPTLYKKILLELTSHSLADSKLKISNVNHTVISL